MNALSPITVARYLVGSREAIRRIASDRWALPVGLLLVISGGLARNYDGAYLPAEWRVLLHGPAVSTANALLLYALVYIPAYLKEGVPRPRFVPGFLSFLGLFWLTSPMAWLYAIPYERFLSPVEAIHANLWTLAVVAVWRVALMVRVLSVLYGAQAWAVTFLVILFADAVLFAGARLSPAPVVDLMGGLQQSPEDAALANINFAVTLYSFLTGGIWIIGGLIAMGAIRPRSAWPPVVRAPAPRGLAVFAAAALLAWAPILALTQPEQRLRFRAERTLRAGEVDAGLAEMSAHRRDEYPPIWDPPPRLGYLELEPSIDAIRQALARGGHSRWVHEVYLDKSWVDFARSVTLMLHAVPAADRETAIARAEAWWPQLDRAGEDAVRAARFHIACDTRLTREQRERLTKLVAEHEPEPAQPAEPVGDGPPLTEPDSPAAGG